MCRGQKVAASWPAGVMHPVLLPDMQQLGSPIRRDPTYDQCYRTEAWPTTTKMPDRPSAQAGGLLRKNLLLPL